MADSPSLVTVSFQRSEDRKFKFLEGEPKVLGITQMCLSIFHISCVGSFYASNLINTGLETPAFIACMLVFIAGSLAVAAKNLHLPVLRACLGMEVLASIAALFNMIVSLFKVNESWLFSNICWNYYYSSDNETPMRKTCNRIQTAHARLFSELVAMNVALFAISVTLLVYTAKVARCCTREPKVPVITIQAPPPPQ